MSEFSQIPEDLDFEALMRSKSWADLAPEERDAMAALVSGEEEYEEMRTVLAGAGVSRDTSEGLTMMPEARDRMMDLFDRETTGNISAPQSGSATGIRRRIWLTAAAAAALFIVVASVWWVVIQRVEDSLPRQKELASRMEEKEAESAETNGIGSELPGNPENAPPLPSRGAESGVSQGSGGTVPGGIAGANGYPGAGDTLYAFKEQKYAFEDLEGVAKADVFKTIANKEETVNAPTGRQTAVAQVQEADAGMKKMVVSERPSYERYLPEKKLRSAPRPASKDPELIGFLFACQ